MNLGKIYPCLIFSVLLLGLPAQSSEPEDLICGDCHEDYGSKGVHNIVNVKQLLTTEHREIVKMMPQEIYVP